MIQSHTQLTYDQGSLTQFPDAVVIAIQNEKILIVRNLKINLVLHYSLLIDSIIISLNS